MRSCLKKIPAQPATPKKIALGCLGPRTSRGSISRRPHGLDARNPNRSDLACDEHTCRKWPFTGLYTGQEATRALRNKNPSRNPRRFAVNTHTSAWAGIGPAEWKDGGPDGGRARPSRTPCAGGLPRRGSEHSRRQEWAAWKVVAPWTLRLVAEPRRRRRPTSRVRNAPPYGSLECVLGGVRPATTAPRTPADPHTRDWHPGRKAQQQHAALDVSRRERKRRVNTLLPRFSGVRM